MFALPVVPVLYICSNYPIDGKQRKAQYEDGYQEAGYRSAWQVLSNAFTAFVAAFLWNLTYDPQNNLLVRVSSISAPTRIPVATYDQSWCPIVDDPQHTGLTRLFIFAAVGCVDSRLFCRILEICTDTLLAVLVTLWRVN